MEHSPYSLDFAPSDFYLFLRVKECFIGQKFEDDEVVIAAVQVFNGLTPFEELFKKKGISCLEGRYNKLHLNIISRFKR